MAFIEDNHDITELISDLSSLITDLAYGLPRGKVNSISDIVGLDTFECVSRAISELEANSKEQSD